MLGKEFSQETKFTPVTFFDQVFFEAYMVPNEIFPQSHLLIVSSIISKICEDPELNFSLFYGNNFSQDALEEILRRANIMHQKKGLPKIELEGVKYLIRNLKNVSCLLAFTTVVDLVRTINNKNPLGFKTDSMVITPSIENVTHDVRKLQDYLKFTADQIEVEDIKRFFDLIMSLMLAKRTDLYKKIQKRLNLYDRKNISPDQTKELLSITEEIWTEVLGGVYEMLDTRYKKIFPNHFAFVAFFKSHIIRPTRREIM
jgi:hypothetical protein